MFQFKIHKDTGDMPTMIVIEQEEEEELGMSFETKSKKEDKFVCGKLLLMIKMKGWRREMRFREIIMQKSY